jgi:hypothetical protein
VQVRSYANTSVCLSSTGRDTCGLTGYFLRVLHTGDSPFTVPVGFHYSIFVRQSRNWIAFESTSSLDVAIDAGDFPISLTFPSLNPETTLRIVSASTVSINNANGPSAIVLRNLELSEVTLSATHPVTLTVTGNASLEVDIFHTLVNGIFSGGRLSVHGILYLRDSPHEYLESIEFSETGCTLRVTINDKRTPILLPQDEFTDVRIGALAASQNVPRFIPLIATTTMPIRGDVIINIESPTVYLTIASNWHDVESIADRIVITSTVGGSVIYEDPVHVGRLFDVAPTVGILNAIGAPVCLYGPGSFPACARADWHWLPRSCDGGRCLLTESREFIVFGIGLSINIAPGTAPTIAFGTDTPWLIDSLPTDVNLTVAGAPGMIDLIELGWPGT